MNKRIPILLTTTLLALGAIGCKSGDDSPKAGPAVSEEVPVVGDWNGDGKVKTGVFRNGLWMLDYNGDGVVDPAQPGPDKVFQYSATPGDVPVVGDWNGDGKTKTGIFRGGTWILDYDGDGKVDYRNLGVDKIFQYTSTPGDIPVVGDWNGDHRAKTGIFRSGTWALDYDGNGVVNYNSPAPDRIFHLGVAAK